MFSYNFSLPALIINIIVVKKSDLLKSLRFPLLGTSLTTDWVRLRIANHWVGFAANKIKAITCNNS